MNLIERMRFLRKESKQTQEQIADYLGIKRQMYRRYETGEIDLPVRHLMKLADLYQVTTDYILGRSDERNP